MGNVVAHTLNLEPVQPQWTIFEGNGYWVTREPLPIVELPNTSNCLRSLIQKGSPQSIHDNFLQGRQHFRYSVSGELLQGGPDT
jgi:hypothetical protein